MKNNFLTELRSGRNLSLRQLLTLIIQLSIPAILAQISSIIMQYIDASMVGHLGAQGSASIGLVSSSTWLIGGICTAVSTGFTVQIAQAVGAGEEKNARNLVKQGLLFALGISVLLLLFGTAVHGALPLWLGGREEIVPDAARYFLVFSLSIPAVQINSLVSGMLQASGNMKLPSILHVMMCGLDVIFNVLLIFGEKDLVLGRITITIPGAGLGVTGAALGTAFAELATAVLMLYFLLIRSEMLHLRKGEKFSFAASQIGKAVKIAAPVGAEQALMCGAQIVTTGMVAPLGTIAIAANSLSVTAESLCYMPGYGIGAAATSMIGQSVGAGQDRLTKRIGYLVTGFGMMVMTGTGVLLYIFAPYMIGMLSPDPSIRELGAEILRIEAFAEPMYAASIVSSGVFRGTGDTFVPSLMNFFTMWCIRLPVGWILSKSFGLKGIWIAMCLELCARGALFLIRLFKKSWLKKV